MGSPGDQAPRASPPLSARPDRATRPRAFADIVAAAGQESYVTDLPHGRRALNYAVREPLGVVAVIVPWNLPLPLLTWKVAPALACGNALVVKPSEHTPTTAALLAEVLADAGLPAGVYNFVHGFGADSAGECLTAHPGIGGVTFTGSSATGSHVMRAAGRAGRAAETRRPVRRPHHHRPADLRGPPAQGAAPLRPRRTGRGEARHRRRRTGPRRGVRRRVLDPAHPVDRADQH